MLLWFPVSMIGSKNFYSWKKSKRNGWDCSVKRENLEPSNTIEDSIYLCFDHQIYALSISVNQILYFLACMSMFSITKNYLTLISMISYYYMDVVELPFATVFFFFSRTGIFSLSIIQIVFLLFSVLNYYSKVNLRLKKHVYRFVTTNYMSSVYLAVQQNQLILCD